MKKTLLVVALASTAAVTAWTWTRDDAPAPAVTDSKLALNRLWIDHIPRNERDTIQVFVALNNEALGVFQALSQWKGAYEVFQFELQGDELRLVYPHNGDKEKVAVKARTCDEKGFDYCLDLKGASRGVKHYYSLEGWDIEGVHTPADLARRAEEMIVTLVPHD